MQTMQTLNEEEEYNWTQKPGRDIVIAVDHGPKSKHAFDWALVNFCRPGDTIHLVHSVSSKLFVLYFFLNLNKIVNYVCFLNYFCLLLMFFWCG